MDEKLTINFIRESNKIEGIYGDPDTKEVDEFHRFMELDKVTIKELERFVSVYQPDAKLRDIAGRNVYVGNHIPIAGGIHVRKMLEDILKDTYKLNPYLMHIRYEILHPFTDCNGRSGRMLWAWQVRDLSLGFLHRFYYQTLSKEAE